MSPQEKLRDVAERAIKTFIQAFLGVFLLGIPVLINQYQVKGVNGGKAAIAALAAAALAAGISALQNFVKNASR